ncbi:hypothetical protein ATANTOWER_003479 [Ataeniobius toweri]|uniref:Uncharacterized protein n=1 Tax=Ataeniobius toweri TaxID=208326 RepID=A0ABU7A130_9TELE|nr:hypothetical protein [Ataeniobius toweri]
MTAFLFQGPQTKQGMGWLSVSRRIGAEKFWSDQNVLWLHKALSNTDLPLLDIAAHSWPKEAYKTHICLSLKQNCFNKYCWSSTSGLSVKRSSTGILPRNGANEDLTMNS